jgi:hypothetical protein
MGLSRKKSRERAGHAPPVARVERLWNGWKAGIRKKDM